MMISSERRVALVGAGNMGGAMAARLVDKGWHVTVFDTDPLRCDEARTYGADVAQSAAEAARSLGPRDALIIAVVDALQVRAALFGDDGAVHGMQPGQTVLLCPTIAPGDTAAIGVDLNARGLDCIDAPMSGGPARARAGEMSLMVAARKAVRERHLGLLGDLSSQVFDIGERVGDGARTKLVNNLLAGINLVGAAEVLALAERMGLDLNATLNVIEHSSGQSWIGSDRMRRAIDEDFSPRAHMTLLEKDTRLAVQAAAALGWQGPLGPSVANAFQQASAAGYQDLDDAALLSWLRQVPTMAK